MSLKCRHRTNRLWREYSSEHIVVWAKRGEVSGKCNSLYVEIVFVVGQHGSCRHTHTDTHEIKLAIPVLGLRRGFSSADGEGVWRAEDRNQR
jgi:hypothetical protein